MDTKILWIKAWPDNEFGTAPNWYRIEIPAEVSPNPEGPEEIKYKGKPLIKSTGGYVSVDRLAALKNNWSTIKRILKMK